MSRYIFSMQVFSHSSVIYWKDYPFSIKIAFVVKKSAYNCSYPSAYMVFHLGVDPCIMWVWTLRVNWKYPLISWPAQFILHCSRANCILWEELQGLLLLLVYEWCATLWPSSFCKLALQVFSGVIASPVIQEVFSTYIWLYPPTHNCIFLK